MAAELDSAKLTLWIVLWKYPHTPKWFPVNMPPFVRHEDAQRYMEAGIKRGYYQWKMVEVLV